MNNPRELTAEEKQNLRHAVLAVLALRHPNALTPRAVFNRVTTEVDFIPGFEAVEAALALLAGHVPPLAEKLKDELGSGEYWRVTSAGVLFTERRGK